METLPSYPVCTAAAGQPYIHPKTSADVAGLLSCCSLAWEVGEVGQGGREGKRRRWGLETYRERQAGPLQ